MILSLHRHTGKKAELTRQQYLFDESFLKDVSSVIAALVEKGYDPYTQLNCFLHTGNAGFITRSADARLLAMQLDKEQLRRYIHQIRPA